jgi:hypothetical protein
VYELVHTYCALVWNFMNRISPDFVYKQKKVSVSASAHCNENPTYVLLFWELRSLSPNFHIHVTVSDLYIYELTVGVLYRHK